MRMQSLEQFSIGAYFLYPSANPAEINNKKAVQDFSFLHREKYNNTNPSIR